MITHHVETSGYGVEAVDPAKVRRAIFQAEELFSNAPQVEVPVEHMFVPGLYFRRIDLPAGSWNTGKLHAQEDGLIIASGRVTFHTEHGERTFEGPCMTKVKALTKPLVHAWTDVVMFSAHANPDDETDLEAIESRVVIKNELGHEPKEVLK